MTLSFTTHGSENHYHTAKTHQHGQAMLTIAMEKNRLELELESPAANIVGFEHKASTADQQKLLEQAKIALNQPQQLFHFTGTQCEIQHYTVDFSTLEHIDHHDDDVHDSNNEIHSEITAHYQFSCQSGDQLQSITVGLIIAFPDIEHLEVQWVTDKHQGATELSAKENVVQLR